jgi:hypothetical protein
MDDEDQDHQGCLLDDVEQQQPPYGHGRGSHSDLGLDGGEEGDHSGYFDQSRRHHRTGAGGRYPVSTGSNYGFSRD